MSINKPLDAGMAAEPEKSNRIITVEGMKGIECVSNVSAAVNEVKDLHVDAVTVGRVNLRSATQDQTDSACAAIKHAGFVCNERYKREKT